MKPFLLFALCLLLLSSACASEPNEQPSYPNSYPSYPSNSGKPVQEYLPPAQSADPNNPYAPLPGDARLQIDTVYLNSSELQTVSTFPPEYMLVLQGSLPTPCHALRVKISPSEETNTLTINVYSVTDSNTVCTQVLQPFSAEVPIRNLIPIRYKVVLNGEEIAEIDG
jgi:hypothetical protein